MAIVPKFFMSSLQASTSFRQGRRTDEGLSRFPKYGMRFSEIIAERVRPNWLFHACDLGAYVGIFHTNTMDARTAHRSRTVGGVSADRRCLGIGLRKGALDKFEDVKGISLTRDIRFARKWKSGGVVLVINADRLRQRHRILGVQYYKNRLESEEFVIGPIKNVMSYVDEVQISQETYDWCSERDEWADLCSWPKLVVSGYSWDDRTGAIKAKPPAPIHAADDNEDRWAEEEFA